MAVLFSEDAFKFLRGLARHNERPWFEARKSIYESELKAPLLALIAEINESLLTFAPEHVRPPQKVMMRIYRDIRFSANKAPYKTQVSAWWSHQGVPKTSGAGFYFSVSPSSVVVAAGVYMPEKMQLLAIRRHLVEHHAALQKLLSSRKRKTALPEFEGARLSRPPKGFSAASLPPGAMELIQCRQWGVSATLPAETAFSADLRKEIVGRFRVAAPLVALLNAPLLGVARRPMF